MTEKEYKHQWYLRNKERLSEQQKQYYSENKEKILERNKKYKEKHKNVVLEQVRKWHDEHSEYMSEYYKSYRETHKKEKSETDKKYRATPMGRAHYLLSSYKRKDKEYNRGEGDLTAQWIVDNIFTKPCAHCGETDWHKLGCNRLDNSKPHTKDNVETCCRKCNISLPRKNNDIC